MTADRKLVGPMPDGCRMGLGECAATSPGTEPAVSCRSDTMSKVLRAGLGLLSMAGALWGVGCAKPSAALPSTAPVVAGLEHDGLDQRVRGLVLLGELGCVACHAPPAGAPPIEARVGPELATVGSRVHPDYLLRLLADPHAAKPGTVMPDLLRDLDDDGRRVAAESLRDYLWGFSVPRIESGAPAHPAPIGTAPPADAVPTAALRGRELFVSIGCAACHAPREEDGRDDTGNELPGSVPLGDLGAKYRQEELQQFLLASLAARPAGRMPDFGLSPSEAFDLTCYLVGYGAEGAGYGSDPRKREAGRALFAERGCASCHELPDPQRGPASASRSTAKPLRRLVLRESAAADAAWRGCLAGTGGAWPFYPLSDAQRADIAAAVAAIDEPLGAAERIQQRLASRNCLACHERDGRCGIAPEREPFFGSNDASLGEDGRVPPALTGVGAKLQPAWLADVIAHGQRERRYLRTRMPGFGDAFAGDLAALLAAHDELPPIVVGELPESGDEKKAVLELGRELVGDQGMNCITCHLFAGEQVGAMGALDLVATTGQRLRPEWFAHYLRKPFTFKPGTLMPQFFPDGVSTRPELADGDVARQIDAMWHYLAQGRNVREPRGLRRPPIELVVADEAVILRRSVQNTGKRGISVGYPGGVNITFDAENLGLNQLWWGRFVDARPVWSGQGSGQAHILEREVFTLPNGPAFVVLPDAGAAWPTATRRELGQRWLGYDLDAEQRPTLRYVCADVEIADMPREVAVADAERPLLRRTLRFTTATDVTLTMRAALAPRIEALDDTAVRIGRLQLRLPPSSWRVRPAGDQQELLVTIPVRDGAAELVLDYVRQPEGK